MKAWKRITTFKANISSYCSLFDDGGPYKENSPLICSANQRTGFCVVGTCHERVKCEETQNTNVFFLDLTV